MNETEAKVRCLELAYQIQRPTNVYNAETVANIAKELYAFVVHEVIEAEVELDKPRRGRPPKGRN